MVIWYHCTIEKSCDMICYLVKLGSQKRLCHADHLLHSRVTSTPNVHDVPDLELTPASDVSTSTLRFESESTTMPVAV